MVLSLTVTYGASPYRLRPACTGLPSRPARSRGCAAATRTRLAGSLLRACARAELGGLGPSRLGAADVQERLLGKIVEVTVDELLEGVDGDRKSTRLNSSH